MKKEYIWFCEECGAENNIHHEETDYMCIEAECYQCGTKQEINGFTD